MRIGIITQPLHANYGGILQCYALQTVLERAGHNVEVLQRKTYNTNPLNVVYWAARISVRNVIHHKNEFIFKELRKAYQYPIEGRYTHEFIAKYIHVRELISTNEVKERDYDAYVVGSDQVWRYRYNGKRIFDSFLFFAKDWNIKRVAYAASFGTDFWEIPNNITDLIKKQIKKFNLVSVREDSGVMLCKNYLDVDACQVLDPTLLLSSKDYLKLIPDDLKSGCIEYKYIATYILDESDATKRITSEVARALNLNVVRANSKYEDKSAPLKERIQPPVEKWLKTLAYSDFVIADSFHACAFSIIFKKQFVVLGNKERGLTRLKSIVDMFEISDHLIVDVKNFSYAKYVPIDYSKVDKRIKELQESSMSLLLGALRQ